ncbi:MAG TPA: RcnB family protein [Candidatus Binatia bacterium]
MTSLLAVAFSLTLLLSGGAFAESGDKQSSHHQKGHGQGHGAAPHHNEGGSHHQSGSQHGASHHGTPHHGTPHHGAPHQGPSHHGPSHHVPSHGHAHHPAPHYGHAPRAGEYYYGGGWHGRLHGPAYVYPHGWHYRRWPVGGHLPAVFLTPPYFYADFAVLGLAPPAPGYAWVRFGPDLLLVNLQTGIVDNVIYGVFY